MTTRAMFLVAASLLGRAEATLGAAPPAVRGVIAATCLDGHLYLLAAEAVAENQVLCLPIKAGARGGGLSLPTRKDFNAWSALHVSGDRLCIAGWYVGYPALLEVIPRKEFGRVRRARSDLLKLEPISSFALGTRGNVPIGLEPKVPVTADARYAFAVGPYGRLHLFLAWRGKLKIWEGKVSVRDGTFGPKLAAVWAPPPKETTTPATSREVSTTIREAFFAYCDDTNFYFVTTSGQVHCLPRRGGAKRTTALWNDPGRPVRVVINDAGSGHTYAFAMRRRGAGAAKKPDVFFRLDSKLRPGPADAPTWGWAAPDWRARAAGQYAAFLLQMKLLRPGPTKASALLSVSADAVAKDFEADERAARARYTPDSAGGRAVRVSGEVAHQYINGSLRMKRADWAAGITSALSGTGRTVVFSGTTNGKGRYASVQVESVTVGDGYVLLEGVIRRGDKPFK